MQTVQKKPSIKNRILPVFRRIEDFFIPPLCIVCNNTLDGRINAGTGANSGAGDTGERWFCAACVSALAQNHNSRDACPRCSSNRRRRECACEFAWDFPFESVFAVFDYDDTLSPIAKHIKYHGKSRLAHRMGAMSAPLLPPDFFIGIDFMIPVPLHRAKLRRRGYNQAEWLAKGILSGLDEIGGIAAPELRTDLLIRTKNTVTQTQLDKEGRLKNLEKAFAANPQKSGELAGKSVVLVDDIFTTGATTEACTDELLRAGCALVRVLALGHD